MFIFVKNFKTMQSPFLSPFYLMAKPAGSICNLACDYCYYLEKAQYYKQDLSHRMSDEMLDLFVKEYIESQASDYVNFTWHGGETLLRDISFYKKAFKLQRKYAKSKRIENVFQTNGTLLNDAWCRFFKENDCLVGISVDGPQRFHDRFRLSPSGRGSFDKVMKGIDLLNRYEVEWNAMAVVNAFNADFPLEFYHFFKDLDCHFIQFAPIVERALYKDNTHNHSITELKTSSSENLSLLASLRDTNDVAALVDFSVSPQQWGNFLCSIFDEWVRNDVGNIFVQIFDSTLANWVGQPPGACFYAKECGHAAVIEFNGDVYSCDHFVFPSYKLGNIREKGLQQMMYSKAQQDFGKAKAKLLPSQCLNCKWLFACNGECPKNRFAYTKDKEPFLNYLCSGYYKYYSHVAPYMDYMAKALENEQAPALVMDAIARGEL